MSMSHHELRDPAEARHFVAQGLCWQRIGAPRAEDVAAILDWASAIASEGDPLPPLGFIADVGHLVFRSDVGISDGQALAPMPIVRAYEDHVLGKLMTDASFERAGDALRSYKADERARGLAFVVNQMRQRLGFDGVVIAPSVLKSLRAANADDLLREARESIGEHGPMPLLLEMVQSLIREMRSAGSLLGQEDILELERKTAVSPFSQRLALRQVVAASARFQEALPRRPPRSLGRRHEAPTRILEEDTYPVGGFASISTRGSIESLLHSQLALMETDRPDLFDIKYLRDKLLYYSRDENNFLRRRRTFVIALFADLAQARVKDFELPCQRIVLLLALLRTVIATWIDWLSTESLVFEILLIDADGRKDLAAERELLEMLLADQIANGTTAIHAVPSAMLPAHCAQRARRSLCNCLLVSANDRTLEAGGTVVTRLVIDKPIPAVGVGDEPLVRAEADTAWLGWAKVLETLLTAWI
ncbi:MAG: hypothetical protein HYR84_03465 [Planctomycetes bacterium]|nr:hypothetical protein [Planctomycetota bacterium]